MKKMKFVTGCLLVGMIGILVFSTAEAEARKVKIAAPFGGVITDGDFNTLGYQALQEVSKKYNVESAYSERVSVPDMERVIKEYINDGFNLIWVHGSEFVGTAKKLSPQFPDVSFIIETDEKPAEMLPNFWYMNRQFYVPKYPFGYLGALATKTGKIGYIVGMDLPLYRGEINAVTQGIHDAGSNASLTYAFVGEWYNPVKARQAAEGIIAKNCDIIICSLSIELHGATSAIKQANKPVYFTSFHADKSALAPQNYLSADLTNFTPALDEIVKRMLKDEKNGYVMLEYGKGKGRYNQFPIQNVSKEINDKVQKVADDLEAGKIKVVKDFQNLPPNK
jgi:basic membrane protein A and related proteins